MGTKRKSLFTRGKRQFAFEKCLSLLESVLVYPLLFFSLKITIFFNISSQIKKLVQTFELKWDGRYL